MQQAGIPAWKKIGLKLKYAKESPERTAASNNNQEDTLAQLGEPISSSAEPPKKKRRVGPETNGHATSTAASDTAIPQTKQTIEVPRRAKKLKKRVSFSADTKPTSESPVASSPEQDSKPTEHPADQKRPKPKSKQTPRNLPAQRSNASLEYLHQYYANRSAWKFSKNRETWILKHVLTENDIPREYDLELAKYIHGLQSSGARERLQAQCLDLLQKEREARRETNASHEDSDQARDQEFSRQFHEDLEVSSRPSHYEEGDKDYMAWVREKTRARLLLWSLGFDDRVLLTNGNSNETHKERKRKNRTAVVDLDSSSSSSSSSSSESDSDTDSDTDSDEQFKNQRLVEEETSSSGSSDDDTDSDSSASVDSED